MATAPNELAGVMGESAARAPIWRGIAERPYAPETLLLYSALSFFFLGRNLIGHFSDRYIGMGHDPALFMFFLEWWRYALANHVNPFNITAAWYPYGFNLALTTCVPLAAFALLPIEIILGPVAAYNAAILLSPALSAWTAFLLCRYITRSYWPSAVAGYIFGFSPYMLAHSLGHLHLVMVFFLPAIAYLAIQYLKDEVTDIKFIIFFSAVLLGQALSSLEVLATMTLAGSAFLVLTYLWADEALRHSVLALIGPLAACFTILTGLISPYLYYFFRDGSFPMSGAWSSLVCGRPLGLVVPATTNLLGDLRFFNGLVSAPSLWDTGEYVGVPLLLLVWNLIRHRWTDKWIRILIIFFFSMTVATFGVTLWDGNKPICPLPWRLVAHLPIFQMILPARFAVYMFLDLAVLSALWLNTQQKSLRLRIIVAFLLVASLLPNLSASYWTVSANVPEFFKQAVCSSYLSPKETVLVLPYGHWGDSDIWLAETRMYFRMAGGYLTIVPTVPADFDQYPIVTSLYNLVDIPDAKDELKCFLAQKQVGAVIVADEGKHVWRPVPNVNPDTLERTGFTPEEKSLIESLMLGVGAQAERIGGVTLYRIPLNKLKAYQKIDPRLLQDRIAAIRFARLVEAAHGYVVRALDIHSLTPLKAQELGLLPDRWVGGIYTLPQYRRRVVQDELVLGPSSDGTVGVGVLGPKPALEQLASKYSPFAVYRARLPIGGVRAGNGWLLPPDMHSPDLADAVKWVLLMEFRPYGLAQAAKMAERVLAEQAAHPLIDKSKSEDGVPKAAVSTISAADRPR